MKISEIGHTISFKLCSSDLGTEFLIKVLWFPANQSYFLNLCEIFSNSRKRYIGTVDMIFSSNHNIHKSLCGICLWASGPLIDRFYKNLSIKVSEDQKKCHMNFYECCDLTKKVYLQLVGRFSRLFPTISFLFQLFLSPGLTK